VPAPAPKAAVAAAPKLEGFAVQIGAFKDEAKLKVARDKLVAAKIPHYIERRESSIGELTRLRAGPYSTREAADKALAAMKAASIDGKVVPLP
ncbi:MAG TPA: SPOR domain-containing protein, partial [Usitatibacter sp.]